jgi:hypothetical protein
MGERGVRMTHLCVAATLLLVLPQQAGAGTAFPGPRGEVTSPHGGWVVRWIPADQTSSGEHELVLVNARDGGERRLLLFPRHVIVSWSPDGRRFAVVNYTSSTDAESWVYSVEPGSPVSVSAAAEAQQAGVLSFTRGAGHVYVEADRWLNADTLSVRVWGYGGVHSFDRRIRVTLGK